MLVNHIIKAQVYIFLSYLGKAALPTTGRNWRGYQHYSDFLFFEKMAYKIKAPTIACDT
jgi:hypothetical protein